ncbi:MAG TPA: VWA domain-containing protein, partial [Verrucomicrobiae bacterium]|nr:VWA domain-containing protein [Verrucomicrobiae bacterium]
MRFAYPHLLWLLLVLPPALAVFFLASQRKRQALVKQFIQGRLLPSLTVGLSPGRQKFRFVCLVLDVALLIVALARPQWGFTWQEATQRGLDIVVAIDTSKSMLAEDIAPSRLARAKLAALDLMQDAKADRLGLVAFAGDAFLECPLTVDDTAFRESVNTLDVNTMPQGGTAIAAAIKTAVKAFKEEARFKVLVLLTDGGDNEPGALQAAREAAKAGLRIFTVGIGTPQGDLLRITDANGNSDYIRDANGNVVKSHLNATLLREIASATPGGFYLPLQGANPIETLYEKGIAPLPKSETEQRLVKHYKERFYWPLAAAILLLLVEMFLPERRRVTQITKVSSGKSPVPAQTVLLILALGTMPLTGRGSPATALRDYNAGHYTNALQEFFRLAQAKTNDLRLLFNAGDAAYRATNFDQARGFFQQATLSPHLKLQQKAFYNLGNTQFELAKSAKDLDGLQNGLETAEKSFEHAVELDKNDADAAHNLAFVKNAVEQIKKFREAIRHAKSEADVAVRRAEFHRALEIMLPLEKTIAA